MKPKLQITQFTLQEQWEASRHLVQKNKKKYERKEKHRTAWRSGSSFVYLHIN